VHRIKVIALVVFFILAICISSGGIGPEKIGFRYWHDPGAFADSINGVAKTFVVAGTLYAGTEMSVWIVDIEENSGSDQTVGSESRRENRRIRKRRSLAPSNRSFGAF
jgi:amino acid permease